MPVRPRTGKAPRLRYCPNRREQGKYDPSRGGGSVPGSPVAGRGDRAAPPGFAGASGWRPALVAAVFFAGIARRSTGGPGHNDNRSRTPRHSQRPGKSGGAGARRGSPSPPLRREGTTAARQGNLDPIYRWRWDGFSGRCKKPRSLLTAGVFAFRLRLHPARAPASLTGGEDSTSRYRRPSQKSAALKLVIPCPFPPLRRHTRPRFCLRRMGECGPWRVSETGGLPPGKPPVDWMGQ